MTTPMTPSGGLPDQGMWSQGSLSQVLHVALPVLIWVVVAIVAVRFFRKGATLFATAKGPAPGKVEPLPAAAEPVVSDGRAHGYSGFDPELYGPRPEPDPGLGDPEPLDPELIDLGPDEPALHTNP